MRKPTLQDVLFFHQEHAFQRMVGLINHRIEQVLICFPLTAAIDDDGHETITILLTDLFDEATKLAEMFFSFLLCQVDFSLSGIISVNIHAKYNQRVQLVRSEWTKLDCRCAFVFAAWLQFKDLCRSNFL